VLKLYEAMFLFDNMAAHEWSDVEQEVKRVFDRIGATQHVCVKFDERRLAFEIEGRKRGTYVLTYFDAEPDRIGDLERDARLSEVILRLMVVRPEGMTEEKLAALKAHPAETPLTPATDPRRDREPRFDREGGREGGRDGYRDGGRDGGRPSRRNEESVPSFDDASD
jgi:small subunit ribosomal protein S6